MTDQMSLKTISAQVNALQQAMSVIYQGTTPDHGKWSSVNGFVVRYNDLARNYISLTGESSIRIYDTKNLKSFGDSLWPIQKGLFDSVYTEILVLQNMVSQTTASSFGPLYNLFVSGSDTDWKGQPFQIETSRCIREYTSPSLTMRFGSFDVSSRSEIKRAPCVFAYESGIKLSPKFGYIRDIVQRQGQVRIEYDIQKVEPFLTAQNLEDMKFELDIAKLELNRTHWAVKEVNLPKELHSKGITLLDSVRDISNSVDVSKHIFDVALSFPGETRPLVEKVVQELERRLGPNSYFYDNNYISQLAQPSLDTLLQGVYKRAKVDVVFLSTNYQKKDWCGVEFRAVKEIIFQRENTRVMFIRTDDGSVDGVFKTDGYIDARKFTPSQITEFICQRLDLFQQTELAT